jgi:hypothetical protein
VFIFVLVYFVIDSIRELLDTPSYVVCPRNRPTIDGLPDSVGTKCFESALKSFLHRFSHSVQMTIVADSSVVPDTLIDLLFKRNTLQLIATKNDIL